MDTFVPPPPLLVRDLIAADTGFIGEVFRAAESGLTPEQLAAQKGHRNSFAANRYAKAIRVLTGDLQPSQVRPAALKVAYYPARRWVSMSGLWDAERARLELVLDHALKSTDVKGSGVTQLDPGVYVYSYPLYLDNPVDPVGERTLFKVGASAKSVAGRLASQSRHTEIPEEIQLLRVYPCGNAFEVESKFHEILSAAGHWHSQTNGGAEWFLTKLELLDAIASALGVRSGS